MADATWEKFGLTQELTVVVAKPSPDTKLGITLSSYEKDVGHPRVRGETHPWPCETHASASDRASRLAAQSSSRVVQPRPRAC